MQPWDDGASWAEGESAYAGPVRQSPSIITLRASLAGLLASGVAIATLTKIAYQTESIGRDGAPHNFQKPWFLVMVMFLGMSLCLPVSLVQHMILCIKPKAAQRQHSGRLDQYLLDPLISPDEFYAPSVAPSLKYAWRHFYMERQLWHLLLPALFDLAGSALLNIGLVFVSASATQMLRQSLLLFATALAVVVYRKPLNRLHFIGLGSCLAGLAMVAAASLVGGFGGRWDLGPPTADSQDAPLAPAGPLLDRGLTGQTSGLEALTNATLLGTTSGTTAGGRWGGSPLWALLFGGSDSRSSGGSHGSRGDDDGSSSAPGLDPPWSGSWIVEDRREMGLGIGLILASQALQALQLWVDREQQWREERTQQLSPLGVVGCEGIIGLVLTAFLALPLLAHGPGREGFGLREDTIDSLMCIWHSHALQAILLAQLAAMQLYNGCMMLISGDLDMTRTTLLQAIRTLFVWAANLLLHAAGAPHLGEPLAPWSILQAVGFATAAIGAAIYARGDDERVRQNMQLEAALIMLDQPHNGPGSLAGSIYSFATSRASGGGATAGGGAWRVPGGGAGSHLFHHGFSVGSVGGGGGVARAIAAGHGNFDVGSIGRSMMQGVPPPAAARSPSSFGATPPPATPLQRRSLSARTGSEPFYFGGGAAAGAGTGTGSGAGDGGGSSEVSPLLPPRAGMPQRSALGGGTDGPAGGAGGGGGGAGAYGSAVPLARRSVRIAEEWDGGASSVASEASGMGAGMPPWLRASPPTGGVVTPPRLQGQVQGQGPSVQAQEQGQGQRQGHSLSTQAQLQGGSPPPLGFVAPPRLRVQIQGASSPSGGAVAPLQLHTQQAQQVQQGAGPPPSGGPGAAP